MKNKKYRDPSIIKVILYIDKTSFLNGLQVFSFNKNITALILNLTIYVLISPPT